MIKKTLFLISLKSKTNPYALKSFLDMCVGFIVYQFHFSVAKEAFGIMLRTTERQYVESAVFVVYILPLKGYSSC